MDSFNLGKGKMRFGTWNVRSLYRSNSLKTAQRELTNYKPDIVAVQEVRWDKEIMRQHIIICSSMKMEMLIIS
jgi:exonuclease III